jgi:hypothetical protein
MRTLLLALVVGWCGLSAATTGVEPPRGETPRATDLLRAERLADQVRRRLELPPARPEGGWRAGGTAWRRRETPASALAQDGDVIINVKPPARPSAGPRAADAPPR